MSDEVLKRLDALAAKVGMVGAQLWSALLANQRVDGCMFMLFGAALLGLGYGLHHSERRLHHDDEMAVVVRAATVGALVLLGAWFMVYGGSHLLAPEQYALSLILGR